MMASARATPPPPPPRTEEAQALLLAYEASLAADATIPPCEPLRAVLKEAKEADMPLTALNLRGVPVGKLGAKALADVLVIDSFITFANLEDAGLGDEGAVAWSQRPNARRPLPPLAL